MRQADIKRGRTYMNWPDTATRTVTAIRDGVVYFDEVRRDSRPPRVGAALISFAAGPRRRWMLHSRSAGRDRFRSGEVQVFGVNLVELSRPRVHAAQSSIENDGSSSGSTTCGDSISGGSGSSICSILASSSDDFHDSYACPLSPSNQRSLFSPM
jgi:hypothetical protein